MNTLVLLAVSFGTAVMLTGLLRTAALHIGFLMSGGSIAFHTDTNRRWIGGRTAIFIASATVFYTGQLKGAFPVAFRLTPSPWWA